MSFLVEFPKKKRQKRAKVLRYNAGCEVRWKLWGGGSEALQQHAERDYLLLITIYYLLILIRLLFA